jgi:hypothetical protein
MSTILNEYLFIDEDELKGIKKTAEGKQTLSFGDKSYSST